MDFKYQLSKFIPVPMSTAYVPKDGPKLRVIELVWWQWRGRCFNVVEYTAG